MAESGSEWEPERGEWVQVQPEGRVVSHIVISRPQSPYGEVDSLFHAKRKISLDTSQCIVIFITDRAGNSVHLSIYSALLGAIFHVRCGQPAQTAA